jgi:predicted ATPase
MPQQRVDEGVEQLVNAELIFRRGTPPDAEYTFKQALVQDAAYSSLLRSSRQQLHARVAATLESRFLEIVAAEPAILAQHCTEAGLAEKAISYWLKAGQQSIARCAITEALAQLRKGLDLLASIPDGTARQEQELDLQITLGHALMAAKGLAGTSCTSDAYGTGCVNSGCFAVCAACVSSVPWPSAVVTKLPAM